MTPSIDDRVNELRQELRQLKCDSQNQHILHQQEERNHHFLLQQAWQALSDHVESGSDGMGESTHSTSSSSFAVPPPPPSLSPEFYAPSPSKRASFPSLSTMSSPSLSTSKAPMRRSSLHSTKKLAESLSVNNKPLPVYVAIMKSSYHRNPSQSEPNNEDGDIQDDGRDDANEVEATTTTDTGSADSSSAVAKDDTPASKESFNLSVHDLMPNLNIVQKQACVLQAMHRFVQVYPNQIQLLERFQEDLTKWNKQECDAIQLQSKEDNAKIAAKVSELAEEQVERFQAYQDVVALQNKLLRAYRSHLPDEKEHDNTNGKRDEATIASSASGSMFTPPSTGSPSKFAKPIMDIPFSIISSLSFPQTMSPRARAKATKQLEANDAPQEEEDDDDNHIHWSSPDSTSNLSAGRLSILLFNSSHHDANAYSEYDMLPEPTAKEETIVFDKSSSSFQPDASASSRDSDNVCGNFIVDWNDLDEGADMTSSTSATTDSAGSPIPRAPLSSPRQNLGGDDHDHDHKDLHSSMSKWSFFAAAKNDRKASGISCSDATPDAGDATKANNGSSSHSHGFFFRSFRNTADTNDAKVAEKKEKDNGMVDVFDRSLNESFHRTRGHHKAKQRSRVDRDMHRNLHDMAHESSTSDDCEASWNDAPATPEQEDRKTWMERLTESAASATASAATAFLDA